MHIIACNNANYLCPKMEVYDDTWKNLFDIEYCADLVNNDNQMEWKKYYNKAIDNLKKYVSEANPKVNQWLRIIRYT